MIPPQIVDVEMAQTVEAVGSVTKVAITSALGFNLVITLLIAASMQQLWSMIRAMQLIIISVLVMIPLPWVAQVFFSFSVMFANMDVLSGEDLYDKYLGFSQSSPLNDQYEMFGIGSRIFLPNTGSYFIIQAIIIGFILGKYLLNRFARLFARFSCGRRLGIWASSEQDFMEEATSNTLKLFMESIFENSLNVFLAITALYESEDWQLD